MTKVLRTGGGKSIKLGQDELGEGAEGVVRSIVGTEDFCAKLYFDPPPDTAERLEAFGRHPLRSFGGDHGEHLHLAWPWERLMDAQDRTVGFLMPRVGGERLERMFMPDRRLEGLKEPTWGTLVDIAERVARLVDRLHSHGVVIGDLSPANIMVSPTGHVTLIDCDTIQFTDHLSGRRHACRKLTPGYTPPEIAAPGKLSKTHDDFALAVVITSLLMEGEHPFEGVPVNRQDGASIEENIRLQNNRIVAPERFVPVTSGIPATVLPPQVRALASQSFGIGHRDPSMRPTAAHWVDELSIARGQLMGCRVSSKHLFHIALQQ